MVVQISGPTNTLPLEVVASTNGKPSEDIQQVLDPREKNIDTLLLNATGTSGKHFTDVYKSALYIGVDLLLYKFDKDIVTKDLVQKVSCIALLSGPEYHNLYERLIPLYVNKASDLTKEKNEELIKLLFVVQKKLSEEVNIDDPLTVLRTKIQGPTYIHQVLPLFNKADEERQLINALKIIRSQIETGQKIDDKIIIGAANIGLRAGYFREIYEPLVSLIANDRQPTLEMIDLMLSRKA